LLQVLQWSDYKLLPLLEQQLHPSLYQDLLHSTTAAAVDGSSQLPAVGTLLSGLLYTTSNICSGTESHKAAIMSSSVPQLLLQYISFGCEATRAAAASLQEGGHAAAAGSPSAAAAAGERILIRSPGPSAAAAAAVGTSADGGTATGAAIHISPAAKAVHAVALPAVWCVINLLWTTEESPFAAAAAAGGNSGASQGARSGGRNRRAASAAAAAAEGPSSSPGGSDVAMAAAEESGDTSAAAVTARAAALRALGFEGALKGLLEAQRQAAAEAAAAAGGMVHTAASTTAAAAAEGAGAAPEVELQDLFERLQTALAQLGVGGS
jgi:hypothetical protein